MIWFFSFMDESFQSTVQTRITFFAFHIFLAFFVSGFRLCRSLLGHYVALIHWYLLWSSLSSWTYLGRILVSFCKKWIWRWWVLWPRIFYTVDERYWYLDRLCQMNLLASFDYNIWQVLTFAVWYTVHSEINFCNSVNVINFVNTA